jgi:hypothetical protein
LATLSGATRTELASDLLAIHEDVRQGVSEKRAAKAVSTWRIWCAFCAKIETSPDLSAFEDPVEVLLVFARRWRDGRIAPKGEPTRARTPEDAVRQVGQAFAAVGAHDPRFEKFGGKLDHRLRCQFRGWKRLDPPAKRKKPVPMAVLTAFTAGTWRLRRRRDLAMSDLMWLGFYFLLRPSEYLRTGPHNSNSFLMEDVAFRDQNGNEYSASDMPLGIFPNVTQVGLTFTLQKNGVSGETIWLHTLAPGPSERCPVRCAARRILHLRHHNAPPTTPLYTFYDEQGVCRWVADRYLTNALRIHALALNLTCEVTIGALRCTGATAMLNSKFPIELIKLIGRWRSDEVFRYLHTQSTTLTTDVATRMLANAT